jgi:hypothetical protein
LLVILIAIPVTVVSSYIPAAVTGHKLLWIALLAAAAVAIVVLTVLAGRSSVQETVPQQAAADPVVVGEIPREPAAFVARATVDRLAAAAGSGQVAVLCAVTGLRGVGKTQVAAAYARDRIAARWALVGWVNAESPDVLLGGLARVADLLALQPYCWGALVPLAGPVGAAACLGIGGILWEMVNNWPRVTNHGVWLSVYWWGIQDGRY